MQKWNLIDNTFILHNCDYYKEFEIQISPNSDSRTETLKECSLIQLARELPYN